MASRATGFRAVLCVLAGAAVSTFGACADAPPPLAAAPAATCPDRLDTDQSVRALPDGFTASPSEGLVSRLSLVSFTEGDDEPGADVQPQQSQADGHVVRTWQFTAPRVRLHCAYAATRLVLTRDMPKGVSRCTATLDSRVRVAGEPKLLQLECR